MHGDLLIFLFIYSIVLFIKCLILLVLRLLTCYWLLVNLTSLKRGAKKLTLFHYFIALKFLTTVCDIFLLIRLAFKFFWFGFLRQAFVVRTIVFKVIVSKNFMLIFVKNLSIGLILLHLMLLWLLKIRAIKHLLIKNLLNILKKFLLFMYKKLSFVALIGMKKFLKNIWDIKN